VFDPGEASEFEAWTDPESGVTSHIFDPDGMTGTRAYPSGDVATSDGSSLWLQGNDSERGWQPVVLDTESGTLETVPEFGPGDEAIRDQPARGAPVVDPDTGTAYAVVGDTVRKRTPGGDCAVVGSPTAVVDPSVSVPPQQPTLSADGERLSLTLDSGRQSFVGAMALDPGRFDDWQSFDAPHGHAQFSPADPNLLLVTRNPWQGDPESESRENSLRLIRESLGARPLSNLSKGRYHRVFWSGDAASLWVVDARHGLGVLDVQTAFFEWVWAGSCSGGAVSGDDRQLVRTTHRDDGQRRLECSRRNRDSSVAIVSAMPGSVDGISSGSPRFVCEHRSLMYTTTVRGEPELALASVRGL